MKQSNISLGITYSEFELLQFLVMEGTQEQILLPELIPQLKKSDVDTATKSLRIKGLVMLGSKTISATKHATAALKPYKVKRAIILAGGLGQRMRPETKSTPKPMVRIGNKPIIETQLDSLIGAGITDITIIRGYLGGVFDALHAKYPGVTFIDTPYYDQDSSIESVLLAIDLLPNAYFIEGDLYIQNPRVIRPYEYSSSYCGIPGNTTEDWYFCTDTKSLIRQHGHGSTYKFVGIMFWREQEAEQLKKDIRAVLDDSNRYHKFIESIPFDPLSGTYSIISRPIQESDVIELDTYDELMMIRNHTL